MVLGTGEVQTWAALAAEFQERMVATTEQTDLNEAMLVLQGEVRDRDRVLVEINAALAEASGCGALSGLAAGAQKEVEKSMGCQDGDPAVAALHHCLVNVSYDDFQVFAASCMLDELLEEAESEESRVRDRLNECTAESLPHEEVTSRPSPCEAGDTLSLESTENLGSHDTEPCTGSETLDQFPGVPTDLLAQMASAEDLCASLLVGLRGSDASPEAVLAGQRLLKELAAAEKARIVVEDQLAKATALMTTALQRNDALRCGLRDSGAAQTNQQVAKLREELQQERAMISSTTGNHSMVESLASSVCKNLAAVESSVKERTEKSVALQADLSRHREMRSYELSAASTVEGEDTETALRDELVCEHGALRSELVSELAARASSKAESLAHRSAEHEEELRSLEASNSLLQRELENLQAEAVAESVSGTSARNEEQERIARSYKADIEDLEASNEAQRNQILYLRENLLLSRERASAEVLDDTWHESELEMEREAIRCIEAAFAVEFSEAASEAQATKDTLRAEWSACRDRADGADAASVDAIQESVRRVAESQDLLDDLTDELQCLRENVDVASQIAGDDFSSATAEARSLWLECRNLRAKLNDCGREGALPVVGEESVPRRAGAQRDEITITGAGGDVAHEDTRTPSKAHRTDARPSETCHSTDVAGSSLGPPRPLVGGGSSSTPRVPSVEPRDESAEIAFLTSSLRSEERSCLAAREELRCARASPMEGPEDLGLLREELRTEEAQNRQLCLQALSAERSRRRLLQEMAPAGGGGTADALEFGVLMSRAARAISVFAKVEPPEPDSPELQPFVFQRSQLQTLLPVADASLLM